MKCPNCGAEVGFILHDSRDCIRNLRAERDSLICRILQAESAVATEAANAERIKIVRWLREKAQHLLVKGHWPIFLADLIKEGRYDRD